MVSSIPLLTIDLLCCVNVLLYALLESSSVCLPTCFLSLCLPGSPMTTRKLTACPCVCAEKVRHLYPI